MNGFYYFMIFYILFVSSGKYDTDVLYVYRRDLFTSFRDEFRSVSDFKPSLPILLFSLLFYKFLFDGFNRDFDCLLEYIP